MPLKVGQGHIITEIANLLADFLPATFNNTTSFPIAARNAGVEHLWSYQGGKKGSVARMLKAAYEDNPRKMLRAIKQIVDLGLGYRSRGDKVPISRQEVELLNELLLRLKLRIESLNAEEFLCRLPGKAPEPKPQPKDGSSPKALDPNKCRVLREKLISLSSLLPQERGYKFESFLNELFAFNGMEPKRPFRNRGEQIDGSFVHRHEIFLLEAKWQTAEIAVRELYAFASKVETKAAWARGLFISESGFTEEGLFRFRQGKPTSIICMNGYDLYLLLEHRLKLEEVMDLKKRHAVETGDAFIPVKDLYPNL